MLSDYRPPKLSTESSYLNLNHLTLLQSTNGSTILSRLQCLITFQLSLKPLAKFEGNVNNEEQTGILYNAIDYLELVDYTGRIVKEGKRGAIKQLTLPILKRLNLNTDEWHARSCAFEENYHRIFAKRRKTRMLPKTINLKKVFYIFF